MAEPIRIALKRTQYHLLDQTSRFSEWEVVVDQCYDDSLQKPLFYHPFQPQQKETEDAKV